MYNYSVLEDGQVAEQLKDFFADKVKDIIYTAIKETTAKMGSSYKTLMMTASC